MMKKEFVLISPVHNEQKFIRQMINSVVSQTICPKRWIIVDDGSTDNTAEIIKEYEKQFDFITYYKPQNTNTQSYYAKRTNAFLAGYEKNKHLKYDFLAALDVDLSLPPTYYESILKEFGQNEKLGIASGVYVNKINGKLQKVVRDNSSTPGGLQMFRRDCYESIGGYIPLEYGGDDSLVDIMARMKGWQTHSFEQYKTIHLRPVGVRKGINLLRAKYRQGIADYKLGTGSVFMLAKSLRRFFLEKPYFAAGTARLIGFFYSTLRNEKKDIPKDIQNFVRKEQTKRLITAIHNKLHKFQNIFLSPSYQSKG